MPLANAGETFQKKAVPMSVSSGWRNRRRAVPATVNEPLGGWIGDHCLQFLCLEIKNIESILREGRGGSVSKVLAARAHGPEFDP